jgi:hypothetical protein
MIARFDRAIDLAATQLSQVSGHRSRSVEYFHVVFTVPPQIASVALQNARTIMASVSA